MGLLDNLIVFSQWAQTTRTEVLTQQIGLFNEASNGAIVLRPKANEGDFSDETYWKEIANLARRRNIAGTGAITAVDLAQLSDTAVKIAAGSFPVNIPPAMFSWIGKNPEEGGAVIGKQLAEASLQDMLNTGLIACRAALGAVAAVYHDAGAATLNLNALNRGAAKFGDRAGDIQVWIGHSKPVHDLYDAALTNANNLFEFGTVKVVQDGFGRRFIMSDSPSLFVAGGIDDGDGSAADGDAGGVVAIDAYYTLGLTPGAILVEDNGDFVDNIETKNGNDNIGRTYQAEWTYNLGLKGFAWDKAAGGRSPSNAALATATNWDRTTAQDKSLAGVLVRSR